MKRRFLLGLMTVIAGVLAVCMVVAVEAAGQPFPDIVGPELWVDGPAIDQVGSGEFPAVAVDDLGRRIYVWGAFVSASNPPRNDIFMRRTDAEGNPEAAPFLVNTYQLNDQMRPRVAAAADGSFLVIWESQEPNIAGTANRFWIRSQAFSAAASPLGAELLVSTFSPEITQDANADVAALRTQNGSPGGFVVVWESLNSFGDDTSTSIQARLVSANGTAPGPQFQVNDITLGSQTEPAVTELADGGFLIVWEDPDQQLQGKRFNAAATAVGGQFQISTTYDGSHSRPDAAIGWDGRIAVVWEDVEEAGDANEIRARIFDADLSPLGADFRVNDLATDAQENPNLADYGPMGFLVTWESSISGGDDNDMRSVQARVMTGPDTFDGLQVQYNIFTVANQHEPASGGWYGRLGSVWRSNGNVDISSPVITSRSIEDCLFCDDFEWFHPGGSGSLWRWSSSAGAGAPPEAYFAED